MREKILVDTGPLVALLLAGDPSHERCADQLARLRQPLYTSLAVITEACWLMAKSEKALTAFGEFFRTGAVEILPLEHAELPAVLNIMQRYRNLRADFADATLLYLAERESISTVFTLDHRDFGVYRLPGGKKLSLMPSLL